MGCCLEAGDAKEDEVFAALLVNFILYTQWPENPKTIRVAIPQDNDALAKLSSVTAGGRTLQVLSFDPSGTLPEAEVYLFLKSADAAKLESIKGKSVLTVGRVRGFLDDGGLIEVFTKDNKFRFKINWKRAKELGLEFSSNLLRHAEEIR